jgi:septal ring factor EnvC (AmiA/AmiB activator)
VLSPADGRVDYAGPLKGWGVVLILRLTGGYHLVLAGLGSSNARVGTAVAAGEPIGRMQTAPGAGKDKDQATSELYLEVRKGETPVDPARWLDRVTARGDH